MVLDGVVVDERWLPYLENSNSNESLDHNVLFLDISSEFITAT